MTKNNFRCFLWVLLQVKWQYVLLARNLVVFVTEVINYYQIGLHWPSEFYLHGIILILWGKEFEQTFGLAVTGATLSFIARRLKPGKQVGQCQVIREPATGTGERHPKACPLGGISRVSGPGQKEADSSSHVGCCQRRAFIHLSPDYFCKTLQQIWRLTWPNCLAKTRLSKLETKQSWAIPLLSLPPSPHLSFHLCSLNFRFFCRVELHNISDLSL